MAGPFSAAPKPSESMQNETTSEWSLEQFQVPEKEGETRFHDFDLEPALMHGIADAGFQYCTPIQAQVLTHALAGADTIGRAQTGTGKTAAFLITIINDLLRHPITVPRYAGEPRALIVAPTRELAMQIEKDAKLLAHHTDLQVMSVVGGMNFNRQQERLQTRLIDILVATPGRLLDFAKRRDLWLDRVEALVLDEADRMLDMGFIPDIERIFSLTPFTRQTLFFSATMAPEIERITNTFLSAPARVEVARQATASETIEQAVVMFKASRRDREGSEKRRVLRALIDSEGDKCTNAIIFCNRKTDVDITAKSLKKYGYDAAPIHGDLDQSQRTRTLDSFRNGELRILVASDVAARGLDVPAVSHVFNFDVPGHAEDYVHRIGRTGRAGNEGEAMSLVCIDEMNLLKAIERLIKSNIPKVMIDEYAPDPSIKAEPINKGRGKQSRAPSKSAGRNGGTSQSRHHVPSKSSSNKRNRSGNRVYQSSHSPC